MPAAVVDTEATDVFSENTLRCLPASIFDSKEHDDSMVPRISRATQALHPHLHAARGSAQRLTAMLHYLTEHTLCAMPHDAETGPDSETSCTMTALKCDVLFQVCMSILWNLRSTSSQYSGAQIEHVQNTLAELAATCVRAQQIAGTAPAPLHVVPQWKSQLPYAFLLPTTDPPPLAHETVYVKRNGEPAVLACNAARLGRLMEDSDGMLLHLHAHTLHDSPHVHARESGGGEACARGVCE